MRSLQLPAIVQKLSRRGAGTVLAIIVHLGIVGLMLFGAQPQIVGTTVPSRGLTLIDLTPPGADQARADQQPTPAPPPPPSAARESPVDASAPADTPSEWSVSRIRVPIPPPPAPATTPTIGTGVANRASGPPAPAGGGRYVYDPYAGSSPQRRETPLPPPPTAPAAPASLGQKLLGLIGMGSSPADSFVLDPSALQTIRSATLRTTPRASGTVRMKVRVSPTGLVLDAWADGGTADARTVDAVRAAMLGQWLFKVRGTVTDPVVLDVQLPAFG